MDNYNKVYDFTNENVGCLNDLYHFENSKVLTVVGSGDQYFTSILNGAKQVDLFDVNPTSYLYFVLKFYAIRELSYEEFYNFIVLKNLVDVNVYNKLETYLPLDVLKYYKYLMQFNKKTRNIVFRKDGIDIFNKKNQKYYFKNNLSVIPYFIKESYYKLQKKLKNTNLPNFFKSDLLDLRTITNEKYNILLASNIYDYSLTTTKDFVEKLKSYDIPEIEACYDWYGFHLDHFINVGCSVSVVAPSSPSQYNWNKNYIYSLKK